MGCDAFGETGKNRNVLRRKIEKAIHKTVILLLLFSCFYEKIQ